MHSRCTQLDCGSLTDAIAIFSSKDAYGNLPLVLIPEHRRQCALLMSVPSGVFCLMQRFGKDMGPAKPGFNVAPGWLRVAYVVTKQSNTYDAPVRSCPTADNVQVDIDVVIVFHITEPSDFVYKLGASNFDEYLRGTVDEAIRKLVRKENIDNVYGLRGDRAGDMLNQLNAVFAAYGVMFTDVKVTAVWLPDALAECLEATTMRAISMDKLKRQQEYEVLKIDQESAFIIENIKRSTEQDLVKEAGNKRRAEISFEQRSVKAEEDGNIQRILAEKEAEVMITEKECELNRKKKLLETYRVTEMAQAETLAAEKKIKGDIEAEMKLKEGSWEEERMVCEAQSVKHEASAEKEASISLVESRKHQLDLREKSILTRLASSGSFNLIGSSADQLISAMLTGSFSKDKNG